MIRHYALHMRSEALIVLVLAFLACGMNLGIAASTPDRAEEWYKSIKPLEDQKPSTGAKARQSKKSKQKTAARTVRGKKAARKRTKKSQTPGQDAKWYDWFWPLGERVPVKALKDKYVPFRTEKDVVNSRQQVYNPEKASGLATKTTRKDKLLPGRPSLAIEVGDGFLDIGNLDAGFEVPLIGAVWQPRLWAYFIYRTTFQTYDNEVPNNKRETEWANRLDLFFNLQLTGTEKILLGLRPVDRNNPNRFTRYTFSGDDKGFNKNFRIGLETLFFEGDLGSLFPFLDRGGFKPIDLGFTVGRQPLVFQEGILINDTVDAVGFIRNNIPFPGTSNLRISGMWGWNRLDRNDSELTDRDENMFGLFIAADAHLSTYNLDMIYVNATGKSDGLYIGASAIQRLPFLGGISTAFRINSSFALEKEVQGQAPGVGANVVGTGTLITSEISKTLKGSDDIVYFNSFLGIGNFTQAGREAIVGGPLANTGILFASPSLSTYLAEINPFTDDVFGGALGYQAFWDNKRRNLILEIAGRYGYGNDPLSSVGVGFQLQQAVGRHVQLQLEGYYTINDNRDNAAGARAEVQVVY